MSQDGREQVTGFHMAGELVGLDGIGTERIPATPSRWRTARSASSLTSASRSWRRECRCCSSHFHKVMSREIVREHGVMLLLGSMRAEERLAAFLLNLSQRFRRAVTRPPSSICA